MARGVRKPEHQWVTRRLRAHRREDAVTRWPDDPRAEAFDLLDDQGRVVGTATLSLTGQVVDRSVADEPGLPFAVKCWLAARGARSIALADDDGNPIEAGPFAIADLSDDVDSAQRIVTLAPSNAEVVASLSCFDRVLACEDSSEVPEGFAALARLGPDLSPDLDRVAGLSPELVVSSLSVPGMERVVTGLRARGLPQRVLAPRSLSDVMADVQAVAADLGVPERGQAVVERMAAEIEALEAQAKTPPVRVYLEWWPRPMFTPGGDCYSRELIALAGGVNVFADRSASSVQIEPAELLAADPDVCFVGWCGVAEDKLDPDNLVQREGLEDLRAAKAGHVYRLDERYSGRPGPNMLEAARRMAEKIASLPTLSSR